MYPLLCLIMTITFVELSIGLTLIGVENSLVIAFLIAVFDILPVLGTGGIMIPWTVITALMGSHGLALGLLVVYLVITVVRNIIEPKIVGRPDWPSPGGDAGEHVCGSAAFGGTGIIRISHWPVPAALSE